MSNVTAATPAAPGTRPRASSVGEGRVTFPGILRSEFIKVGTLRSTWWTLVVFLVLIIGFMFLITLSVVSFSKGNGAHSTDDVVMFMRASDFPALVVIVFGCIAITGEYSTGMIRTTLTTVPKRLPALLARVIVLFSVTAVVTAVAYTVAAFISWLLCAGSGGVVDPFFTAETLSNIGSLALGLGLIVVLALCIGTIARSSAAAIAVGMGLYLVLPIVLALIAQLGEWVDQVVRYLPPVAFERLLAPYSGKDGVHAGELVPADVYWQNLGILVAWVAVAGVIAALLLKKRDA